MNERRVIVLPPPVPEESRWCLRNYLLRANTVEEISVDEHNAHIVRLIDEIDSQYLSQEFEYYRTGFVLGHFGQRGICISIWHWGAWGTTREIFNHAWYSYGRDYDSLRYMDRKEPAFCEFEVPILVEEFRFFRESVANCRGTISREAFAKYAVKLW